MLWQKSSKSWSDRFCKRNVSGDYERNGSEEDRSHTASKIQQKSYKDSGYKYQNKNGGAHRNSWRDRSPQNFKKFDHDHDTIKDVRDTFLISDIGETRRVFYDDR